MLNVFEREVTNHFLKSTPSNFGGRETRNGIRGGLDVVKKRKHGSSMSLTLSNGTEVTINIEFEKHRKPRGKNKAPKIVVRRKRKEAVAESTAEAA